MREHVVPKDTRREHFAEIVETFGFRSFDGSAYDELREWLMPTAMSTERGTALVEAVLGEMRQRGIVAPAIATVEELCWEARHQARSRVFGEITGELSVEDRRRLDELLAVPPGGARAPLIWLREPPGAPVPKNLGFHNHRNKNVRRFSSGLGSVKLVVFYVFGVAERARLAANHSLRQAEMVAATEVYVRVAQRG